MSDDRTCIRGCVKRGIHFATCERSGPTFEGANPCPGCAPREAADGSLICTACMGRMRSLLADVRDLHGRLTALADPSKATPLDQVRVASTATEPPGPVSADLLDAIGTVTQALDWAYADLTDHVNNLDTVTYLCALILNRHPDTDGIRHAWSLQDAVDRWGVERRDRNPAPWEPGADTDEAELGPVTEWRYTEQGSDFDPIVTIDQAATHAKVTRHTIRRWMRDGILQHHTRLRYGTVTVYGFRLSDVTTAQTTAAENRASGLVQNRAGG